MINAISPDVRILPGIENQSSTTKGYSSSFAETLKSAIQDVNSLQVQAGKAVEQMVSGEAASIHDVMISVEKAKVSFDLLMEVRNKALDVYREMMKIQI